MIDFSNMLGKPLRHAFTPADEMSVTFVFEDGMRRSFGAVNSGGTRISPVQLLHRDPAEGMIFTATRPAGDEFLGGVEFVADPLGLVVTFPAGGSLTELPE